MIPLCVHFSASKLEPNNRLQGFGVLNVGQDSKRAFRAATLRKEFRLTEPGLAPFLC